MIGIDYHSVRYTEPAKISSGSGVSPNVEVGRMTAEYGNDVIDSILGTYTIYSLSYIFFFGNLFVIIRVNCMPELYT